MGRPKLKESKKQYTIMLKPSVVSEIDKLAKKLDMTRSQLMGNLVESGLDDAKMIDNLGLFKIVTAGGKAARKLKQAYYKGKLQEIMEEIEKDLILGFDNAEVTHDYNISMSIVRWAYSQAEQVGGQVWIEEKKLERLSPTWKQHLARTGIGLTDPV